MKLVSYGRTKSYNLSGSEFRPEWGGLVTFLSVCFEQRNKRTNQREQNEINVPATQETTKRKNTCLQTIIGKLKTTTENRTWAYAHTTTRDLLNSKFHLLLLGAEVSKASRGCIEQHRVLCCNSILTANVLSTYLLMQHMCLSFSAAVFATTFLQIIFYNL